jgi:hypothetical protein
MSLAFAYSLQPDAIYIFSAKYGLVDLEQELEPYEQTLNTTSADEIRKWAERVKEQSQKRNPISSRNRVSGGHPMSSIGFAKSCLLERGQIGHQVG